MYLLILSLVAYSVAAITAWAVMGAHGVTGWWGVAGGVSLFVFIICTGRWMANR